MITIEQHLYDFDNYDLQEYERLEQLHDAVIEYNEEYGTDHHPVKTVQRYERKKREDRFKEPEE